MSGEFKPSVIERKDHPWCWFIGMVQSLSVVPWPEEMFAHPKFGEIFKLSKVMGQSQGQTIKEKTISPLVRGFIKSLNDSKGEIEKSSHWSVSEQQDIVESVEYLLNSIVSLKQRRMSNLQQTVRDLLAFNLQKKLKCSKCNHKRSIHSTKSWILSLSLPDGDVSSSLQQIYENFIVSDLAEGFICPNCSFRNTTSNNFEIQALKNDFLCSQLKRFKFVHSSLSLKKFNAINIGDYLVLPSKLEADGYSVFKTKVSVNSVDGNTVKAGHFVTNKKLKKSVWYINDSKAKRVQQFDSRHCYFLVLQKVKGEEAVIAVNEYLRSAAVPKFAKSLKLPKPYSFQKSERRLRKEQKNQRTNTGKQSGKVKTKTTTTSSTSGAKRNIRTAFKNLSVSAAKRQKNDFEKPKSPKKKVFQLMSQRNLNTKLPQGITKTLLRRLNMKH